VDQSLNILLAEDDRDDALLMQRAFHSLGVMRPLHIVHDGAEAIDYIAGRGPFADRVRHPAPNYVILDLKMPRVSGFEVLEFLQKHNELMIIPTVVWSNSCDVRDVKRAYCLGANGYLQKATDYEEFKATRKDLLAYWGRCIVPVPDLPPECADLRAQRPFEGATH
jgi:CheY-like chemotaxis protein